MAKDEETKEEQRLVIEKAYRGDRPTPIGDKVTDKIPETGVRFSYKGQRPDPTPVSEEPSNEKTSDES